MKNSKRRSKKTKIDGNDPLAGDLSNLIREGNWKVARFELSEKKNKVISLRLGEKLLLEIKKRAHSLGIDTQKFIRIALENVVGNKAG